MTLEQLNKHLALLQRRERVLDSLAALRSQAEPGAQVLTGMPHVTGVKDKVGDLAVEIADLSAKIDYLQKEIEGDENRISTFVSTIEDDQTRIIFRLRFSRGLSWKEVAAIMGRDFSEKSVSEACYKYLKQKGQRKC